MKEQANELPVSEMGLDRQKSEQEVDVVPDYVEDDSQRMASYLEKFGKQVVSAIVDVPPVKLRAR